MKITIGIQKEKATKLTKHLNVLLSNYQLFYQNLRGFHWNITGGSFFELHEKYEEMYNQANLAIDEIAERILTLEETPLHSFTDYIEIAEIKETNSKGIGVESVQIIIKNLSVLISLERELFEIANDANDEGTATLMSDYIKEQEKTIWMLRAYSNLN